MSDMGMMGGHGRKEGTLKCIDFHRYEYTGTSQSIGLEFLNYRCKDCGTEKKEVAPKR